MSLVPGRSDKSDAQDCKEDRSSEIIADKTLCNPSDHTYEREEQQQDTNTKSPFVPVHKALPLKDDATIVTQGEGKRH